MHRPGAGADRLAQIVEHVVAAGILSPARQRDLAPALLAKDEDPVRRGAQIAAGAGRDRQAEMRLMRRLALVLTAVAGELRAQTRLLAALALAFRERPPRRAMRRRFWRAALGNPEVQLVGVEEVIAAVDQGGRHAVGELDERGAVRLGRPLGIEDAGLRAHAFDEAAAEEAHG